MLAIVHKVGDQAYCQCNSNMTVFVTCRRAYHICLTAVSQVRCKHFLRRYLARVVAAQHAAVLGDGFGVQANWAAAASRAEQVTQRQRLQALQRQEAPLTGGLARAGVSSIHAVKDRQAGLWPGAMEHEAW